MSKKVYKVTVYDNGNIEWRLNRKLHREDGPAVEFADGNKYWYQNGCYHREDGPACEYAGGYTSWYLNGKNLTEKEHKQAMSKKDDCVGKVVEVDGKKYKLVSVSEGE